MKKYVFSLILLIVGVFVFSTMVRADLVVMKNGLRHECKIIKDDPDDDYIIVRVVYGNNMEGTVSIPRKNIKEIQLSFESRLELLQDDDYKGMYDLAMFASAKNMEDEAFRLLERCAGKEGVPSNAWLKLAKMYIKKKKLEQAVAALEEYYKANPNDKEAKEMLDALKQLLNEKETPKPSIQVTATPTPKKTTTKEVEITLLEGLEATESWAIAAWAGSGAVTTRQEEDNTLLAFNFNNPGKHLKSVCYYIADTPMDAINNRYFSFSALNSGDKGVQLSLALSVGESNNNLSYYETPLRILPSNKWTEYSFDLQEPKWKTKPEWKHSEKIPHSKIWAVYLLVYPGRIGGTVFFDNISFKSEENEL